MRYLIIGLGIYGSNLALDLTNMGHEVIGADSNPNLVDAIKDTISTAYILDSTEEVALSVLPLRNIDLVIVAIGENFGASIKTVAILKKLGVKHIFARAADDLHRSILEGFNIDRILNPEERAASDLVNEMGLGFNVESMQLDEDHYIMTFRAPSLFFGMAYSDLNLKKDYDLKLIAAGRSSDDKNIIGVEHKVYALLDLESNPDEKVREGDTFTCLGSSDAYSRIIHAST